jgi:hypothetical protein
VVDPEEPNIEEKMGLLKENCVVPIAMIVNKSDKI